MKKKHLFSLLLMCPLLAQAQIDIKTEAQVTAAGGNHNPLWLNANKYGLSSLDKTNGYLRVGAFRSIDNDSLRKWKWGAGIDAAVAAGFTSTLVVQQAYGELKWMKGLLTVGSKEQPMELKNQMLSSGAQALGVNARPVPGVRLSLPDYWDVPFTNGWLGMKGHFFYGMMTDDGWQKDFTLCQSKYTEHAKLHTKAGYLRIGKKRLTAELGIEMACQYGGTSYLTNSGTVVENEDGIKGMLRALIPGGGEAVETTYRNTSGNHLGSWLARVNLDYDSWGVSVYADHYFEDQSSMFLLDYDGYGSGEEWNVKKDSRFLFYGIHDTMLGAELSLKQCPWLSNIVVEYLHMKYLSGPIYHDHTQLMSDHLGGRDNFYNHYLMTGWQHWGQVMGNPLYRSPLYNNDGQISIKNNRFWAWHFGITGQPVKGLSYRALFTFQKGYGTYEKPFPEPQRNVSMLAEASYAFSEQSQLAGWSVKGAFGLDSGELLGDNTGVQITIGKKLNLGK